MAGFLRDLPAAWAANPEERNAPARIVFQSMEIEGDQVTAFVLQPGFAPIFDLLGGGWARETTKGNSALPRTDQIQPELAEATGVVTPVHPPQIGPGRGLPPARSVPFPALGLTHRRTRPGLARTAIAGASSSR